MAPIHGYTRTLHRVIPVMCAVTLAACTWAHSFAAESELLAVGQRDSPLTRIPASPQNDQFYLGQRTRNGTLTLTANECFFPKLGLECMGSQSTDSIPDNSITALNKGESFSAIRKWDSGDVAEWGLVLEQTGDIQFRIHCDATAESTNTAQPASFEMRLEESSVDVKLPDQDGRQVITGDLHANQKGFNSLQLICQHASREIQILAIELTGDCLENAAVVRKRWRPAAAHTRFTSSEPHGPIRLWVMEMDALPGPLPFYSPITTPFGYYGPTWLADGRVNTGFNFSLWSFGRGKKAPPIDQLSHLLAAGNRKATLGGFSHEGTGVKIRNWEPLQDRQGQRQALALRVEPGAPYDRYYSYFYANNEKRWRLFGIGNRYNNGKPLDSLWVGSFVEVPGRASVQRTGAYPRTMRYRGWCMDTAGKWYCLDQMSNGNINKETGLTHTHRGVNDEGWFFLQTGGWTFRKPPTTATISLDHQPAQPHFLSAQDTQTLTSTPSSIEFAEDAQPVDGLSISFIVHNMGKSPLVTLHYGNREALTFADQWQHKMRLPMVRNGQNQVTVPVPDTQAPIFLRLRLENEEGVFWSGKTVQVTP